MRHYFAYGSNMIVADMKRRAPDSVEVGNATLEEFRIVLAPSGYASVVPAAGSRVYGVLWRISAVDERALDEYEGVNEGLYRKEQHLIGGVRAMIYVETSGRSGEPILSGYLESIIRTAEAREFPEEYIRELRSLRYNRDIG